MQHNSETRTQRQTPGSAVGRRSNDERALLTKEKIFQSVILCLDMFGYSETSINRVQDRAGVSRGALTHHFPSKEVMMVKTLERLLDPVRGSNIVRTRSRSAGKGDGLALDLMRLWRGVVNTREGRALFEILSAARTDATLRAGISPSLATYNRDINLNIVRLYRSVERGDQDVIILWGMCRAFLRGLHVQERFDGNPDTTQQMIERFAELIGPQMETRNKEP